MKCLLFSRILLAALMVCASMTAVAGVSWEQLSERERSVLQPFEQQWSSLPESSQQVLRQWAGLSASKRTQIRRQHEQWNAMSANEQRAMINKLDRYKRMSPEKKRRIKAWQRWVKSLPLFEQRALHEKWPTLNAEQRREYIQRLEQKYGSH